MRFGKHSSFLGLLALVITLLAMATPAQAVVIEEATIGTANSTRPAYYTGPYSSYYYSSGSPTQYVRAGIYEALYTEAEMTAAGIPPGAIITNIAYYKTNDVYWDDDVAKIIVAMGTTKDTSYTGYVSVTPTLAALTRVVDKKIFNLPTTTGWISMGNMTPFTYTGDSLEVFTYIDTNNFGSQPVKLANGSQITSYSQSPSWAASLYPNMSRGYSYSTSSSSYSVDNPYPGSMYVNSGGYYYDSTYHRADIQFTYYVPLVNASPKPAVATGGVPYEHLQIAKGGTPPYFWSIQRNANADWLNIDAGSGRLHGNPSKALGGLAADFTVTLTDDNGLGDSVVSNFVIPISVVPGLPYSNDFEKNLDGFKFTTFEKVDSASWARNSFGSATPGGNGLVLDSTNTGTAWPLDPWATPGGPANLLIIEDPASWFQGVKLNPGLDHHGIAELIFDAPGIKKLQIDFDYRTVVNSYQANRDGRANLVVEVSEDLGANWTMVSGPLANSFGFYWGPMNAHAHETIQVSGLSGKQEFVQLRFRWMSCFSHLTANFGTYVALDNLVLNAPLEIPYDELPAAQETAPYNVLLQGAGGVPPYTGWKITFGTLPTGMALVKDGLDWYLRAAALTIPSGAAGKYTVELELTDTTNKKVKKLLDLIVAPKPPDLNFANLPRLPSAGQNTSYSYTLTATGGVPFPAGYKWSVESTNAPWLDFAHAADGLYTGRLAGVVPANSAGQTVLMTVRLEDAVGTFVISNPEFTLDIVDGIQVTTGSLLNSASEGSTYRENLQVVGGQPPYRWSFISGRLPLGLALRPLEGRIVGAAYVGESSAQGGVFDVRLRVDDAGTQFLEKDFQITVTPASSSNSLTITTGAALPSVGEGNAFKVDISASGGYPPYSWSILPGTAPPGVTITPSGEITGTPTAGSAKTYTLDLRITDSNPAGARTAVKQFSITVQPDILPVSIVTQPNLPTRREGTFYVQTISATGGVAPYAWTVSAGGLPNGVLFNQAGSSGVISGLPQLDSVGNYSVTLLVTDNIGQTSERTFSFVIDALPTGNDLDIVWHSADRVLPKAREGDSYGVTLQGSGGVPPYQFATSPGSTLPPAGVSINAFGSVSGTPVNNTKGFYTFSIRITDSIGQFEDRVFKLQVLSPEEDANGPIDSTPAVAAISANGGCALGTATTNSMLALLAMLFGAVLVISRRRREV